MQIIKNVFTFLILFFGRSLWIYSILHLTALLILCFFKYVVNINELDTHGHNILCAVFATYISLKTKYWINGKLFIPLSKEIGFNPVKFGDHEK